MPCHFEKAESPGKAIQRVCRERIAQARSRLRQSDHPAAVHSVRKEIKKLRAIIALVRGEIGKGVCHKATKSLHAAAKRLAAPRDARVMLKAFEKLAGREAENFAGIAAALKKHARRETRQFRRDDAAAAAKHLLRKINRRLEGLSIRAAGWTAIEPGLRQSYRRGREALKLARRQPLPGNFHAWRKHVKNLGYQLRLLCPKWPAATRAMTDKLEQLGEVLGDDHDLDLLKQFAAKLGAGQAGDAAALRRLIEQLQKKLRATALKIGRRLYADVPAVVSLRMGRQWSDWHLEK